jgi:hypothetical protein
MMHITEKASGYFENVWLWVADHDLDDPALENNLNPMVGRNHPMGSPGTSFEHSN